MPKNQFTVKAHPDLARLSISVEGRNVVEGRLRQEFILQGPDGPTVKHVELETENGAPHFICHTSEPITSEQQAYARQLEGTSGYPAAGLGS